ncbi:calcineurin-like phosphoesterase family protein [Actinocorallia herbida]|uniref:Calcineurin-like phosphoesterase family protein n=1 Tax=Actinocorallia herbida TaxID=58109 RepID=A0A3N1CTM9_9ACTN|nr:metallophosphoesterase [Actinocorallia herbida]ROO84524.1 calcineurin-like phosphoesterase family protein [Actinocorallia herbida]
MAGDWHGNSSWAHRVIRALPELLPEESPRLVLHCGDFGVWPGGEKFLRKVDRALAEVDGVLGFVDGNHEDFSALHAAPRFEGKGAVRERIWHLRRGHRWTWHGRTWLALGGAVSLDRSFRVQGRNWWADEEITRAEAAEIGAAGPAEVMVTHDCPASVEHVFRPLPPWLSGRDLADGVAHRALLQDVVDEVRPSHLMHGHLHRAYRRTVPMAHGPVEVTGLESDGARTGNWAVLDVRTMHWADGT